MHDPTVFVFFFLGALALVGGILYLNQVAEQRRSAALADVALRMGLNFRPKIPKEEIPSLGSFHLFNQGHGKTARNLMTGKADGAAVSVFDYQYTVGGGKNSHTYAQTVAVFAGADSLPEFALAPEHWWDKLGEIFGHKDINFEASPEFSKHYLLKGPDETRIRTAFGAEALGFFAQQPGWSVEVSSGALAIYRVGKRAKPEEMPQFTAEVAAVRRALVHDG